MADGYKPRAMRSNQAYGNAYAVIRPGQRIEALGKQIMDLDFGWRPGGILC